MSNAEIFARHLDVQGARPTYLQIGLNGSWFKFPRVLLDTNQVSTDVVDVSLLNDTTAIEIFFTLSDGRQAFVVFRYVASLEGITSPQDFFQSVVALPLRNLTPTLLLERLSTMFEKDSRAYLERTGDYAEVIVLDYWKEVGTQIVWKPKETVPSSAELEERLKLNTQLIRNNKNLIALEVDFGTPFWIGIEVSSHEPPEYIVRPNRILEILKLFA